VRLFDRFNKDKKATPMFLYSSKELDQYDKYIIKHFGEYKEVFHEIFSPDIHLDIIIIPPTEDCNYYKLITMGMGAYKMRVPEKLAGYELERAELILYLPPTWNIKSDEEKDYWPIRQLKTLARLPIKADTWLGYGHTISSDQKNTCYADNTKFCSIMLLNTLGNNNETLDLRIDGIGKINFYRLFPLYEEELKYKQDNGTDALLNLFENSDKTSTININRKNYGIK